jgi:hypothetical protein
MKEVFMVEELWLDSYENSIHAAKGYKPLGFVTDRQEAEKLVEDAGTIVGTGWPIEKGKEVPKLRIVVLRKL